MTNFFKTHGYALLLAAASLLPAVAADALDRGATFSYMPVAAGAIWVGDGDRLHAEEARLGVWVSTHANGCCAHASRARIVIRRAGAVDPLVNRAKDCPCFFAMLPLGLYEVEKPLSPTSVQLLTGIGTAEAKRNTSGAAPRR